MIVDGSPAVQTVLTTQLLRGASNHTYTSLASSPHFYQPACGDKEGWGPISDSRYDFTPCFLDVWIAIVSAGGVLFGGAAVYYLFRQCTPQPVKQNWHFYAKGVREEQRLA